MRLLKVAAVCLLFTGTAWANEIESPKPKAVIVREHKFWDRWNRLELVGAGTLAATDMTITCRFMGHGFREGNLPAQSCGGVVGLQAGFYVAGLGLSCLLHKTHHHRLERLPLLYLGAGNAYGIASSAKMGAIR